MKSRRRISLKGAQGIALFLNQQQAARQSPREVGESQFVKQGHGAGDERGRRGDDAGGMVRNGALSNESLTTSARAVARAFVASQTATQAQAPAPRRAATTATTDKSH